MCQEKKKPILILRKNKLKKEPLKVDTATKGTLQPKLKRKIGSIEIDIFENEDNDFNFDFVIKDYNQMPNTSLLTSKNDYEIWVGNTCVNSPSLSKNKSKCFNDNFTDEKNAFKDNHLIKRISTEFDNFMNSDSSPNSKFKNLNLNISLSNAMESGHLKKSGNVKKININTFEPPNLVKSKKSK